MDLAARRCAFLKVCVYGSQQRPETLPWEPVFYRSPLLGSSHVLRQPKREVYEAMSVGTAGGMDSFVGQLRITGMPPASQTSSLFDLCEAVLQVILPCP